MVADVQCAILVRGLRKNCVRFRDELDAEDELFEKEANHYKMICMTYFPCDMLLPFSLEDLAYEFSVDITYLFSEFDDQHAEYNEDYNLESFLSLNGLAEHGSVHGFDKETGAVGDLKILTDFVSEYDEECTDSHNWFDAFEALKEYDEQLEREGRFMDQVSLTGLDAATAGFPRTRLAAEEGDEYAKTVLENYAKAQETFV